MEILHIIECSNDYLIRPRPYDLTRRPSDPPRRTRPSVHTRFRHPSSPVVVVDKREPESSCRPVQSEQRPVCCFPARGECLFSGGVTGGDWSAGSGWPGSSSALSELFSGEGRDAVFRRGDRQSLIGRFWAAWVLAGSVRAVFPARCTVPARCYCSGEVLSQNSSLDEYLKIVDAYVDIVLQNQMDNHLNTILGGILNRACNKAAAEDELESLQTILMKLLNHFKGLEDVFALNHFLEILDIMHGSSRSFVNMHILNLATRNSSISDPTTIQLLFEISQALHDDLDFLNAKGDDNQPARLISRFVHMETLVHSSNCLAIKALKDAKKHLSFVKSCIAFGEVTLPSISAQIKQLNLYLETAEVALVCGLVSHSDGLIDSAISCLLSLDCVDGSRTTDIEGILSAIQKLFCLLIMVPGNPEQGVTYFANNILALVNSSSWMTPAMRTRIFCTTLTLTATLSQNKLPYHAVHGQIFGNDLLFFGDSSYLHELVLLSESVLQNVVDSIQKEPSPAGRGCIALEACNCIASSFVVSPEISQICSKLIETAKSCLSANDKYLQSTTKFLDKNLRAPVVAVSSVAV
ncbi:hypothetical protein I3843_Q048600 [Carya illinoinensis]|nr:hypothetical protein I3843_Q048600 [Carya illinoinensis]